jgi:AraC-like DNA-binding protein
MSEDPEAIAREIESYLLAHAPKHDAISLKAPEIVELAENDREIVSVSRLAHALDQAHFMRDFKRVTGVSPGRY